MAIFKFLFKFFKMSGFVVVMVLISYVVTSITYYSLKKENKVEDPIEIIHTEYFECINIYNKENISLNIKLKKECEEKDLVTYAYAYFDLYQEEIYLYVLEENKIVCISKYQEAIILKK